MNDPWPEWAANELTSLACYVVPEAAAQAVGEGFFQVNPPLNALVEGGHPGEAVRELYERLLQKKIRYTTEPLAFDYFEDRTHTIRPPADILTPIGRGEGGRGTSLDLALFFAGLCLRERLRPMVVLFPAAPGSALDALVVVDIKSSGVNLPWQTRPFEKAGSQESAPTQDAEQALVERMNRGDAAAAYKLGLLHSEEALRRGMELDDGGAAYDLGMLLEEQGRTEEAEQVYRRATELGNSGAASNLRRLLRGQGRTGEGEQESPNGRLWATGLLNGPPAKQFLEEAFARNECVAVDCTGFCWDRRVAERRGEPISFPEAKKVAESRIFESATVTILNVSALRALGVNEYEPPARPGEKSETTPESASEKPEAAQRESPRPPRVWLYMAAGEDKRQLELLDQGKRLTWGANRLTRSGDIVLMYRTAPYSDIAHLFRAVSDARRVEEKNEAWPWDYKAELDNRVPLPRRLGLQQIRNHASLADWSLARSPQGALQRLKDIREEGRWEALRGLLVAWNPELADIFGDWEGIARDHILSGALEAAGTFPETERVDALVGLVPHLTGQLVSDGLERLKVVARLGQESSVRKALNGAAERIEQIEDPAVRTRAAAMLEDVRAEFGRHALDFSEYIASRTSGFVGREWAFAEIDKWLATPSGSPFFLVAGAPGTGKSALAAKLTQIREVAAYHACIPERPETLDPQAFVASIILQLIRSSPAYCAALFRGEGPRIEVDQDIERIEAGAEVTGVNIGTLDLDKPLPWVRVAQSVGDMLPGAKFRSMQVDGLLLPDMPLIGTFRKFVTAPLAQATASPSSPPVLIVIDGLDESFSGQDGETIFDLVTGNASLRPKVRFLLTARPDSFERITPGSAVTLDLSGDRTENAHDIQAYLLQAVEQPRLKKQLDEAAVAPGELVSSILAAGRGNFLEVLLTVDRIASGELTVTEIVPKRPRPEFSVENAFGLVVGLGYQGRSPEKAAAKNAKAVYAALTDSQRCCYPTENVFLLLDRQATQEALSKAIDDLARRSNEWSTIFVYVCCEAYFNAGGAMLGLDKPLSLSEFVASLRNIPARSLTVILDGIWAVDERRDSRDRGRYPTWQVESGRRGAPEWAVMATTGSELDYEGTEGGLSSFTRHLVAGLSGGVASRDGLIRLGSLHAYVEEKLEIDTQGKQYVDFWSAETANFPLALWRGGLFETPVPSYSLLLAADRLQCTVGERIRVRIELQGAEAGTPDAFQLPPGTTELHCFANSGTGLQVVEPGAGSIALVPGANQVWAATIELQASLPGSRSCSFNLFADDRHLPRANRSLSIEVTPPLAAQKLPTIFPTLDVHVAARPEVVLRVELEQPEGVDGPYRLVYRLTSRVPDLHMDNKVVGEAKLSGFDLRRIQTLVYRTVQSATDLQPEDVRERMISLGRYLFDRLFPAKEAEAWRSYLWQAEAVWEERRRSGKLPPTWLIMEDEGVWLPWELLVPYRAGEPTPGFFAERYRLSRWVAGLGRPLYGEVPVGEVALAHYKTLEPDTEDKDEELTAWRTLLRAAGAEGILNVVKPDSPVYALHILRHLEQLTSQLDIKLRDGSVHSRSPEEESQRTQLDLRNKRPVVSLSILDTPDPNRRMAPDSLILPNRVLPFLRAGASAVLGPWWPTCEAADHAFWKKFYDLLEREVGLGEAVWLARLAVQHELPDRPDWLAYTLFGDPRAKAYVPEVSAGYATLECLNPDQPLRPNKPYRFRAAVRSRPPDWYQERLIQVEELPGQMRALFLAPGLQQTVPEPVEMQRVGRAMLQASVELTPPMPGNYQLLVQFLEGERHRQTVQMTLKVGEGSMGGQRDA